MDIACLCPTNVNHETNLFKLGVTAQAFVGSIIDCAGDRDRDSDVYKDAAQLGKRP